MTISRYGGRWLTISRVQSVNDVSRHQRLARLPIPGRPLPRLPPPGCLPRPPRSPLPPDPARCCRPRQVFRYGCCMGLEREGCGPGGCCGALMCLSPIHADVHLRAWLHTCVHTVTCTDTWLHVLCPVHTQSHTHMHVQCHIHPRTQHTHRRSVTIAHIHNHIHTYTVICTQTHTQPCMQTHIQSHTHTHAYPHTF